MKNLILVGGNRILENEPIETLYRIAKRKKINLFLYTEKIHLKKKCEKSITFKEFLQKRKINYKVSKNINHEIKDIKKRFTPELENVLLLTNCIWKINSDLINFFKKRIYNIHVGLLPAQKGAGGATWIKLTNSNISAITIHEVSQELDAGRILIEKKFKLKKNFSLINYYNQTRGCEKKTYNNFFNLIKKKIFLLKKQNKKEDVYMPRLNTKIHGFIDWNWKAKHIVDFVNAFSDPYQGASTFIKNEKYLLSHAKLLKHKINFHPYQSGIIFKKEKNSILIAATEGVVQIKKISKITGEKYPIKKLKLGARFFTPIKELEKSKKLTSLHSSKGIITKK
jgi:methionyl-tRNA formyltransferase